jgi:hypothetical protein
MNTYDWADMSLYENFRIYLVSIGKLPDKNLLTAEEYTAAVALLGDDYIPVYGVGNQLSRKERPKKGIFIHRFAEREGNIGAGTGVSYLQERVISEEESVYDRYLYPEKTTDLLYTITIIGASRKVDGELSTIVANVLGKRKYINMFDEAMTRYTDPLLDTYAERIATLTGPKAYIDYVVQYDRTSRLGFDRRFDYRMKDLWVEDHVKLEENIPVLSTVTAKVEDSDEVSVTDVVID